MSDAVQTPSRVYDPTPYRTKSPSVEFSAGGLLCGGRYAWLVSPGGLLRVFQSSDGECVSQLSLSPGKGRRVAVSCSCELSPGTLSADSSARDQPLLALALTVDGVRANATLTVLDPFSSRLVRAVEVPWSVTSLCGVSGTALQSAAGLFSPALLQEFSGVLSVGCAEGHVLLVDLALCVSSVGQGSVQRPLRLVFADGVTQRGSSAVSSARGNGEQLACVDLLASNHKKGQFHYTSTNQATTRTFPTDSLAITSLHFAPQILCLLIGYSIGSFQLYDMRKMDVVHASPPPKTPIPVTHFTFQEPENDPKNNVYIWVARGSPEHANLDVENKLTLYQVLFDHKVCGERGTIYQDFSRCGPGFLYPLTPTPTRPHPNRSLSSSLLLCRTVELSRSGREPDESHDPAFHGPDLTVAMFVWGCGDPAHRDYIIGVFDLNQYYHSQVPRMLHWRTSGQQSGVLGCSYFSFYSLKPMTTNNTILDVAVMDVAPFLSSLPPIPESHLWPTSLSFNIRAITSEGLLNCSCPGLQRKALTELTRGDVAVFSCPQRVFSLCERADLLGHVWDLDHTDLEVWGNRRVGVWEYGSMSNGLRFRSRSEWCVGVWGYE
ncbi:Protein ELYS [Geodia barretti]|uniref:Protein ELYS n=1 Tax=Geodia barretti TaxID=519541 RepID=A0AA35WRB2_GEOBA|nr:Protein ELYS [Geodia barretti]